MDRSQLTVGWISKDKAAGQGSAAFPVQDKDKRVCNPETVTQLIEPVGSLSDISLLPAPTLGTKQRHHLLSQAARTMSYGCWL